MNVYYFGRMEKILVSACLLGDKTRYDGKDNAVEGLLGLLKFYELVPFCPEVEGGLKTPRRPAEIHYGRVFRDDGVELTRQYDLGAKKALSLCKFLGIGKAILKESSPSCGVHVVCAGFPRQRAQPSQRPSCGTISLPASVRPSDAGASSSSTAERSQGSSSRHSMVSPVTG